MLVALAAQPFPLLTAIACWISVVSWSSVRQCDASAKGSLHPLAGKFCVSVQVPPYVTSVVMKSSAATPVQAARPIGAPEQYCVPAP
jgi:hypothetical protein